LFEKKGYEGESFSTSDSKGRRSGESNKQIRGGLPNNELRKNKQYKAWAADN
jgi:hypothetical protein